MSSNRKCVTPSRLMVAFVFTVFAGASFFPAEALAAAPAATASVAGASASKATVKNVVLKTGMLEGKMVFLDPQGKANPVIRAAVGDTIEIVVTSGDGAEHDIAVPDLKVASKKFNGTSGPTSLRFKVTQPGKFAYICTVPAHRQIGMEGVLEVI